MQRLLTAWKTLPTPTKAKAAGLALVVLLALLLVVGGAVGGFVSHWKDSRFDEQEAEREEQRQALETERNLAVGRAEAAEARAKDLETQTRILEVTIAAQGQRAEKAKEKIADEEKRLQDEVAGIDDGADACTRLLRLCERAKRLNLYPKNQECSCN